MSTLEDVAQAIAEVLRGIPGLNSKPYVPGMSDYPGAFVQPAVVDYEALDLSDEDFRLEVVLIVSAATDAAQMKIYPYMERTGAQSVPEAFQRDRTLGLGDVDAFVARSRLLGLQEQAAYNGWGCAFEVPVRL